MKILRCAVLSTLALTVACSGNDSSDGGNGNAKDAGAGGGSTVTGGSGGATSHASGGSGASAGGDSSGGNAAMGGTTAGGGNAILGGSGGLAEAPDTTLRCVGEVEASVETACNVHQAGTKECSPMDGCGNEGGCVPRVSQQACVLRGIGACGTADGGATCVVKLNDPADPFKGGFCVQSSHAAGCYQQMNQGDCLGFDDDTGVDNLCVWEAPTNPKCVALTCAQSFPFEQACTSIPGCEWK